MTTDLRSHEDLDGAFVPRFRDDVAMVSVGQEAVLYEQESGDLHRLDLIGTVICQLFDGDTSLTDLAGELAEAFNAQRDVVEADVLALTRELGRKGLLRGVAGETADAAATDSTDAEPAPTGSGDAPSAVQPPEAPDDAC